MMILGSRPLPSSHLVLSGRIWTVAASVGALTLAMLACVERTEDSTPLGQSSSCTGDDRECVLAIALDSIATYLGSPSLFFVDAAFSPGSGRDLPSKPWPADLLAEQLQGLEENWPELREDTRESFVEANTPPVQSTIRPRTRARLLSLRDSSARDLHEGRWSGKGQPNAYLVDAARVSYLNPGFDSGGYQALVLVALSRGPLSSTVRYFLLERTSSGEWRVVANAEVGVS